MKTVQGLVIIDVDVVALNNAGKDPQPINENGVITKKVSKEGKTYPYVSGQAWRYWWRESLLKHAQWEMSPITRDSKIAYTEANPIQYADDDMFGYMRAAKTEVTDPKTGKIKKENVTLTRISPLKNSALMAIAGTRTAKNWSGMSRHEGDAVPFSKEEYSAMMKGMFSLDLEQAGTFSVQGRTGFKNLNKSLAQIALDEGAETIDDPFIKDKKGEPLKLYRLPKAKRVQRIKDTIAALKLIAGGAMQTNNMADVTPKFIILSTFKSANHPFSHIAIESSINENGYEIYHADLSIEGLKEVFREYQDQFEGTIFIGKRTGFMDSHTEILKSLETQFENVKFGTINESIDGYIQQLEQHIP